MGGRPGSLRMTRVRNEEEDCSSDEMGSSDEMAPDHGELADPQPFGEDTYAMLSCSIVRDMHFMRRGHDGAARSIRLLTTLFFMIVTLSLQIYLMTRIKKYVTAKAVHDVRLSYDAFEIKMCTKAGLFQAANGVNRCILTVADLQKHFATLSNDEQETVCHIPFSQARFFEAILFVWTLSCVNELKKIWQVFICLIWNTKSTSDMAFCFDLPIGVDTEENKIFEELVKGLPDGARLIMQLTSVAKILISAFVLLPRFFITAVLLWLGSRWLAATCDFNDLILNAVALEFILLIKDVIYATLMSPRCKNDLGKTVMMPTRRRLGMGLRALVGSCALLLMSALWVYLYTFHFQTILPQYQWDIRKVCAPWLTKRYSV